MWLTRDLLQAALNRRALVDRRVDARARIDVHGADLSARDNVALGMAANNIMSALTELRDRGLIDDAELLRVAYRFFGETADVAALLERGKAAGQPARTDGRRSKIPAGKVDLDTGEPLAA